MPEMILLWLLCVPLVLYYLLVKNNNYWKRKGVPFDKPFLFFGSFFNITIRKEPIFDTLRAIYTRFKTPYVGIYIFNRPMLLIRSPRILKQILVKDFDKFTNRNIAANKAADPLAYHSLFIAKDSTWRNLRAKLSPVFTSGKMKLMFPLMKECVEDLHTHLRLHSDQVVDIKSIMKKYSVDVIASCAFGIDTRCFENQDSTILKMAMQLVDFKSFVRSVSVLSFFFLPKFVDIFKLTFTDKTASAYLINVFKTTVMEREEKNIVRNDFIDLLRNLQRSGNATNDHKFDDDVNIASQAVTFFSAGNDTTSITLSLTLFELSLNKEIQERLREEVVEHYNKSGEFTYETLQDLKYLDAVIDETLRKYPLAPFLIRQADVDYTIEETGLILEKGMTILVPISGLQYDPEYYPNPQKYDPERFSDNNKHNLIPYTYLPFGEGPRNCIGQRFALLVSKVALAHIIKDFAFDVTNETVAPLRIDPGSLFVQNRGGIYLNVSKL